MTKRNRLRRGTSFFGADRLKRARFANQKYLQAGSRKHTHQAVGPFEGVIRRFNLAESKWLTNTAGYLLGRYGKTGSRRDLGAAIRAAQYAVCSAKHNLSDRAFAFSILGHVLIARYLRKKRLSDLLRSVRAHESAVATLQQQASLQMLPLLLNNLAGAWNHLYDSTGKLKTLDRAILVARASTKLSQSPGSLGRWAYLYTLATLLDRRFKAKGQAFDLEESIKAKQEAIESLPDIHPAKAELLNEIGADRNMYYQFTQDFTEIDNAITAGLQAIEFAPENGARKPIYWGNLSNSLMSRHYLYRRVEDVTRAVKLSAKAVAETPEGHINQSELFANLANKLEAMHRLTGNINCLDHSIKLACKALQCIRKPQEAFVPILDNLATKLLLKHRQVPDLNLIREAIRISKQTVLRTAFDHQDQSIYLNNLANHLEHLYKHTGGLKPLKTAMELAEIAIKYVPETHFYYATSLESLGRMFEQWYVRTGDFGYLRQAIDISTRADHASIPSSLQKATILTQLGNQYEILYERTGVMRDLENAIQVTRDALKITSAGHAELPGRLNNLSLKLHALFRRTDDVQTLTDAINIAERAVTATVREHHDRSIYLNTLGTMLFSLYEKNGEQTHLENAIRYEREAMIGIAATSPILSTYQHNLAISLEALYNKTHEEKLFVEAIDLATKGATISSDNPARARRLINLSHLYESGYRQCRKAAYRQKMLDATLEAWACNSAIPFDRIDAGSRGLRLLAEELNDDATRASVEYVSRTLARAIELGIGVLDQLPIVNIRNLRRQDQQFVLSTFAGVASNLASFLLQQGRVAEAVQYLERGRTVIINQIVTERSDIFELKKAYPYLASQYERLVDELNTAPRANLQGNVTLPSLLRRQDAAAQLEDCITQIKKSPGFSNFLLGLSIPQLQRSASNGYIIMVNATQFGSDGIIISSTGFRRVCLDRMSGTEIRRHFNRRWVVKSFSLQQKLNKELLRALEWLWDVCVEPILRDIGPEPGDPVSVLPRIWWIGTGMAFSLPFHAAGKHTNGSTENTLHRAISSYTPSINALAYARKRTKEAKPVACAEDFLLFTAMSSTPNGRVGENKDFHVLDIEKEKRAVLGSIGSSTGYRVLMQPNVGEVSDALTKCCIAHFACHGVSDSRDPSNSALILQRDSTLGFPIEQDPLTVHHISKLKLDCAQIAYLSACSTAEHKANRLADEVIHLASGFQIAGFPHVIASLWRAGDSQCVMLAGFFYDQICNVNKTVVSEDASLALHEAILKLRGLYSKSPASWAQFVHYGC